MTQTSFDYTSDDGLRLVGTLHGSLDEPALPLLCLPGLTRNARDFDALAAIVRASDTPRPVVALDLRGRGRSDPAARAADYNVVRETQDVVQALEHLGIGRAIFLGTSRGALVTLVMAMMRVDLIAGAILNDAGPRLEIEGLDLIRSTLGPAEPYRKFEDVAAALARVHGPHFPVLLPHDFHRMAEATHIQRDDGIVPHYDPALLETLAPRPLIELWEAFGALKNLPVMVVRGEHSRLLSETTVAKMQALHPGLVPVTARGQGHAPLLEIPPLPDEILAFCQSIPEDDRPS